MRNVKKTALEREKLEVERMKLQLQLQSQASKTASGYHKAVGTVPKFHLSHQ